MLAPLSRPPPAPPTHVLLLRRSPEVSAAAWPSSLLPGRPVLAEQASSWPEFRRPPPPPPRSGGPRSPTLQNPLRSFAEVVRADAGLAGSAFNSPPQQRQCPDLKLDLNLCPEQRQRPQLKSTITIPVRSSQLQLALTPEYRLPAYYAPASRRRSRAWSL